MSKKNVLKAFLKSRSIVNMIVMYRQYPPPAYPGHWTPLPSRGGGNLIIRVFQAVGNLIPMRYEVGGGEGI